MSFGVGSHNNDVRYDTHDGLLAGWSLHSLQHLGNKYTALTDVTYHGDVVLSSTMFDFDSRLPAFGE